MIKIEQVSATVVWPVRHAVMYPDQPFDSIRLADDDTGVHLALFAGESVVSVISLFGEGGALQFRKFATRQEHQGKGYGTQLINHVMGYAHQQGITRLWCNARRSAAGFYKKFGFRETDTVFRKGGIDYVIMEWVEQQPGR